MASRLASLLAFTTALAAAEQCEVYSIAVHCQNRCAGINTSSISSSNPTPEQLSEASKGSDHSQGGHPLIFGQLPPHGSPTVHSAPSGGQFSNQTVYAPSHRALAPDELMTIIGPASSVEWLPTLATGFGCVDGRHVRSGLYAYGGDLGEFTLAISVLEHLSERQIGQAETTRLLEGWLLRVHDAGGRFCACIDGSAVAQLASAVGGPANLEITTPPEETLAPLMLRIVAPEFVGSEHFKWLLRYADTYATRRTLVEQTLRSFYGILWNQHHPLHATLQLHVLSGVRTERAIVHIHTNHWWVAGTSCTTCARCVARPASRARQGLSGMRCKTRVSRPAWHVWQGLRDTCGKACVTVM